MKPIQIGIVGVGAISGIYLENITKTFHGIEVRGVCDLIPERAQHAVDTYPIPKLYKDMYELFADPEIDIVLNLTRPYEHYEVTRQALLAGKHVYTEKPLGATLEEGQELVRLAQAQNRIIAGAPDTFLGAGIQTCRKLIDDGYIGTPVGAAAFMICRGHESWHPDPEFYYKFGGGPMLDMGPYYVTALINLLGAVESVSGMAKISFPRRTITSEPHRGEVIDVDVPTYITGMMRFASGAIGTLFTTFDVHSDSQARFEVYGSEGTLVVPDPNTFGGPIRILRPEMGRYMELPLTFGYAENSRALGLADMAAAIRSGRSPRASSEQLLHVLQVMTSFQKSSEEGKTVAIDAPFTRTPPMVCTNLTGVLDG